MNEIKLVLPLDDDYFLRRCCPYCRKEFKICVGDEVEKEIQDDIESNLFEEKVSNVSGEKESIRKEYTCPYCGQTSEIDNWWTEEQLEYVETKIENILIEIINNEFIKPLKKKSKNTSGLVSIEFKGEELDDENACIPPEENDLESHKLKCCNEDIKTNMDFLNDKLFCFYCGFPHTL